MFRFTEQQGGRKWPESSHLLRPIYSISLENLTLLISGISSIHNLHSFTTQSHSIIVTQKGHEKPHRKEQRLRWEGSYVRTQVDKSLVWDNATSKPCDHMIVEDCANCQGPANTLCDNSILGRLSESLISTLQLS
ncbi:hypothetical protein V6Z92_005871 [Aspergillus fumigatus]